MVHGIWNPMIFFPFVQEFSHASLSRQNIHRKILKPESQGALRCVISKSNKVDFGESGFLWGFTCMRLGVWAVN